MTAQSWLAISVLANSVTIGLLLIGQARHRSQVRRLAAAGLETVTVLEMLALGNHLNTEAITALQEGTDRA